MINDQIIADLYKRGYTDITINTFDGGQTYSIRRYNDAPVFVRVSVLWGEDAAKAIALVLTMRNLPVPASFIPASFTAEDVTYWGCPLCGTIITGVQVSRRAANHRAEHSR